MDVKRIIDLVGLDSIIDGKTIENTLVVGPAVVALIDSVTMDAVQFSGDPESTFITVPEGKRAQGIVGIRNSTFRNCRFQNISFIGTQEVVDRMQLEIGPDPMYRPVPQAVAADPEIPQPR